MAPVSEEEPSAGGDEACWLDRVCEVCGRIPDDEPLDASGRCPTCAGGGPVES